MTSVVVSAVGADRPGIVAAVSRALYECGANIEDASMSILRGHFTMTLVVAGDAGAAAVEAALAGAARDLGLLLGVREIGDDVETAPAVAPYVVSVYGADRAGIVARVTGLLADRGVNVTDLTTRLQGGSGAETYVMLIEVDVPETADEAALGRDLAAVAADLGVTATLHAAAADVL
jgi:glycine cleavage system transcriptional repressor